MRLIYVSSLFLLTLSSSLLFASPRDLATGTSGELSKILSTMGVSIQPQGSIGIQALAYLECKSQPALLCTAKDIHTRSELTLQDETLAYRLMEILGRSSSSLAKVTFENGRITYLFVNGVACIHGLWGKAVCHVKPDSVPNSNWGHFTGN